MEIKEKIKKVYQKNGIKVDDEYIECKMKDKEKVEQFMRIFKQEEIESMNYILGKPESNLLFTKEELELCSKVDLFNRQVVKVCKIIWENKDNPEKLEKFMKILNKEVEA